MPELCQTPSLIPSLHPLKWQSENAPMTANRNMSLSSEKPIQDLKLVLKHYVRTEGDYSVAST